MENLAHTNPYIPSNLYLTKVWCILLEEQSQCSWISFNSPTELKSSFPLDIWDSMSFRAALIEIYRLGANLTFAML